MRADDSTSNRNFSDQPARGIVAGMATDDTTKPTRREKRDPLAGLMPRGLGRLEAARYIGVSATTFDKAVRDRLMPRPFRLYGRLLWCREALDAAVDALRDAETPEDDRAEDSWADYS